MSTSCRDSLSALFDFQRMSALKEMITRYDGTRKRVANTDRFKNAGEVLPVLEIAIRKIREKKNISRFCS